jgi:hypothetical protein
MLGDLDFAFVEAINPGGVHTLMENDLAFPVKSADLISVKFIEVILSQLGKAGYGPDLTITATKILNH